MKKILTLLLICISFPALSQNFWQQTNGPYIGNIRCLAINASGHIFAGTRGGIVFRSTNNGGSWTRESTGLTDTRVQALVVSGLNPFAGTYGSGVWRRPLSEITGIEDGRNNLPTSFSLQQNYPNPFNPTTKISFSIPEQSFVTLKVFDILGREVKTLVNELKHPGEYEIEFSANDLSSGVYIYKIQAGSFRDTKKMLLIR
ncbi:MAG: T9SS type A sorting domain-containing protein [Bacteroidetes bacterium]|nr:T9SS type A sorting domain-containing protein [Bacteroidota bacterium]MBU2584191.1 T9SS type A sorting domain-containing protein [Bacteroidota bacterium]